MFVAGAAGFILVACAAAPSPSPAIPSDGPLIFSEEENIICGPVPQFEHAGVGAELKSDDPDATIVIDKVEPIEPQGVKYVSASLMPLDPEGGGFMFSEYPPVGQFPEQWPLAENAVGSSFTSGTRAALVAEFEYLGEGSGSIEGLLISYSVGDEKFTTRTHLSMVLSDNDCSDL